MYLRQVRLGEVTDNYDSLRRPVKGMERVAGEFPYYGASGIVDYVDNFIFDGDYLLIAEDGANLRSRSTPIAFMATGKFWVNNHAHVVKGNHLSDTRFLSYILAITDVSGYLTGSTQPKLTRAAMDSIQLMIPELDEQKAIVEVLGALDDKIAANTKLAETSFQLAKSIFAAAATNTEGVKVGLSESSHLLSRGITPKYSEDEDTMTILNQKCVRDQRVNLTPARRTDLAKVREEKILSQNDVLVNSTGQGTLGRVARWTHDKDVTVDSHITIIRFNPEEVDPVCAGFAVLRSEREITDMAKGSTGQTELSRIELGKLKILLPPREQQQELGQRLAKMAAMENAYLQENERLAATRDALLPQLMSGKLRVKDAEKVLDESL